MFLTLLQWERMQVIKESNAKCRGNDARSILGSTRAPRNPSYSSHVTICRNPYPPPAGNPIASNNTSQLSVTLGTHRNKHLSQPLGPLGTPRAPHAAQNGINRNFTCPILPANHDSLRPDPLT